MIATPKRIALLAIATFAIVTIALLLRDDKPDPVTADATRAPSLEATPPAEEDAPREKPPKTHKPIGTTKDQLETAEESGSSEVGEYESAEVAKRCDEPHTGEQEVLLPNARLFYRDWQGEEPDDSNANRATACLNETGRTTELGFNNVIDGESFGAAKGAGDFVALTTYLWDGADASSDGFQFWNLRSGKSEIHDPGCGIDSNECVIGDVAVTRHPDAWLALESFCWRLLLIRLGQPKCKLLGRAGERTKLRKRLDLRTCGMYRDHRRRQRRRCRRFLWAGYGRWSGKGSLGPPGPYLDKGSTAKCQRKLWGQLQRRKELPDRLLTLLLLA